MIRPVNPDDKFALILLLEMLGLFEPANIDELRGMLAEYFGGKGEGHFWLVDDDPTIGFAGVVYCSAERMTEGTWNLLLIAVHPDHRGKGRGRSLVDQVELALKTRGGRLLLVETSGLTDFDRTRTFYRQYGFEEEARIRDFYKLGEDKIVFRKAVH